MCTLNRFPKPFHTYGVKEKAIKLSLAASAPLAKDNCLVGQLSYKQLPNGKSTVQIPVYGRGFSGKILSSAAVINQAKATVLEQVIASSDVQNPGKACGVRVIKQRYPYLDRSILSQYTALNTAKYPFARIHKGVFKKRLILSARATPTAASTGASTGASAWWAGGSAARLWLKGIKLELAGRLTTQRSIPRKTVANRHVGKLSSSQLGQYAAKNKLGAYTVKAWLN